MERIGIATLRAIVVDDREGLGAGLEARLQASIDAYVDPWQEAMAPVTPNQFASHIPAMALAAQGREQGKG